jgi:hypothetical protein
MKVEINTDSDFSIRLFPESQEDVLLLNEFPYPAGSVTAGWHLDNSVEVVIHR